MSGQITPGGGTKKRKKNRKRANTKMAQEIREEFGYLDKVANCKDWLNPALSREQSQFAKYYIKNPDPLNEE